MSFNFADLEKNASDTLLNETKLYVLIDSFMDIVYRDNKDEKPKWSDLPVFTDKCSFNIDFDNHVVQIGVDTANSIRLPNDTNNDRWLQYFYHPVLLENNYKLQIAHIKNLEQDKFHHFEYCMHWVLSGNNFLESVRQIIDILGNRRYYRPLYYNDNICRLEMNIGEHVIRYHDVKNADQLIYDICKLCIQFPDITNKIILSNITRSVIIEYCLYHNLINDEHKDLRISIDKQKYISTYTIESDGNGIKLSNDLYVDVYNNYNYFRSLNFLMTLIFNLIKQNKK